MGFSMFSLDVSCNKDFFIYSWIYKDEVAKMEPSACINCGRCVEKPVLSRLIPSRLADYAEHHDEESLQNTKDSNVWNVDPAVSYVLPGKTSAETGNRFYEENCIGNKKEKKLERRRGEQT